MTRERVPAATADEMARARRELAREGFADPDITEVFRRVLRMRAEAAPPPGPKPSRNGDRPERTRFRFIPSDVFAGGDYRPQWLIPGVLVRDQPGVVAGPSKGMKTSLVVDAGVSLAAGRPFLGRFEVPTPVRVAIVSGESGEHTLQETAHRVCGARGVSLADLRGSLHWSFDLPSFPDTAGMTEFAERLLSFEAKVVFIDPTYLCLGEVDAKNLFEMGSAFRGVADTLLKAGVTPVLVHHANRLLKTGEVMELTHLAYSGLEQFCRQFVLLNRAEPYQSDGEHDLWVRVGGSAGHGGLWSVHVSEGVTDEQFGGRTWDVEARPASEVRNDQTDRKKEAATKKESDEEFDLLSKLDKYDPDGNGFGVRALRDFLGWSGDKATRVIARLQDRGVVEACEARARGDKARHSVLGVKRKR